MTLDLVAFILWSLLGLSLALTFVGVWSRSWRPMALAALLSAVFGFAALPSIGMFVLLVTLVQAGVAIWFYDRRRRESSARIP
jgi:hypothetical protein